MTLISKLKLACVLDEWSRLPYGITQNLKYKIIITQDIVYVYEIKTIYRNQRVERNICVKKECCGTMMYRNRYFAEDDIHLMRGEITWN